MLPIHLGVSYNKRSVEWPSDESKGQGVKSKGQTGNRGPRKQPQKQNDPWKGNTAEPNFRPPANVFY